MYRRDLRSYKTAKTPKVKWTPDDVGRLAERTLRSQRSAAKDRLMTVEGNLNYPKRGFSTTQSTSPEAFKKQKTALEKYITSIESELKKRRK